jgi:PTS family beta-glucosides porter, IIABC component
VSNAKKTGPVIPTAAFREGELIGSGTDLFTVDPKAQQETAETSTKEATS